MKFLPAAITRQHRRVLRRFFIPVVLMTPLIGFSQPAPASRDLPPPNLGEAAKMPKELTVLPPSWEPLFPGVTGGFNVDTASRERAREFFNAVYSTSDNVPMLTTADVTSCFPGTNSTAFERAVLRRINWFRAMAGMPASVVFSPAYNSNAQQMAVIISRNNALNHTPPTNWPCYTAGGASVGGGNQALGLSGPEAMTGYIWDFGANNNVVGHRRWMLYPQEQIMGTGDVPENGGFAPANLTYVFDSSINSPRPATRAPYVAWPPAGFAPYPVVYPYWSFALTNADFTNATVSMTSNGVSVATVVQPYETGYGENTIVWVPMGLNAASQLTQFPFSGVDTVYGVTVANVKVGASTIGFSYTVTVFNPAVPGGDYVPATISGPAQPFVNTPNAYACVPPANTNVSSYNWRVSQRASGDLTDNANNGLANFTYSPPPVAPVITNAPDGSGNAFHLVHVNPASQFLQLNRLLLPKSNAVVSFKSLLGYAASDETARVQVSTDSGANWQGLYVQAGSGGAGESTFTQRSLSLSNYAGQPTLLRFNYAFTGGNYYPYADNFVGWCIQNIVVTNVEQVVNIVTTSTASTNFTFNPAQPGNYNLEAAPVLFTEFPLNFGPVKQVAAISNPTTTIVMNTPVLMNNQVLLNFTVSGGAAATFRLLETPQLNAPWVTNTSATFTTNVPGSSYRFTATNNASARFYRVQTP